MTIPALSLHQPWASLCVTRQPCERRYPGAPCDHVTDHGAGYTSVDHQMVKRFETRSWACPPNLIGSRIALHAAKREATDQDEVGDYTVWRNMESGEYALANTEGTCEPLPLGAVVGSAVIEACYPIVGYGTNADDDRDRVVVAGDRLYHPIPGRYTNDISDQLPYGDWASGRFAWLLGDAAPVQERCPWCWGGGLEWEDYWSSDAEPCRVCGGAGRCEPIPARGRQRVWSWEP